MLQDNTGKTVDYIFLEVNPSFEVLSGHPRDHIIGKKVTELYPGIRDLSFDWLDVSNQLAATGQSIRFQKYFDPQGRWYDLTAYSNQPGYFSVIFRDITKSKQAEEALKKNVQLLRDTGEIAKVGGWELDLSTKEVSWTEEFGRIHEVESGYKLNLEEVLNFYTPESKPALEEVLKKAAETGEPYDFESFFIPYGEKIRFGCGCLEGPFMKMVK
jgi:PAS domain S-box-containing protein